MLDQRIMDAAAQRLSLLSPQFTCCCTALQAMPPVKPCQAGGAAALLPSKLLVSVVLLALLACNRGAYGRGPSLAGVRPVRVHPTGRAPHQESRGYQVAHAGLEVLQDKGNDIVREAQDQRERQHQNGR